MSREQWVSSCWDCPACGASIEIFTDAHVVANTPDEAGDWCWEDDPARCPEDDCDWVGTMWVTDEDSCGVDDGNLEDLNGENRLVSS